MNSNMIPFTLILSYTLLIINRLPKCQCIYTSITPNDINEEITDVYDSIKKSIASSLEEAIANTTLDLSSPCKSTITSTYITNLSQELIDNLISHSTKNKNDAMTFEVCMKHTNTKFLLAKINEVTSLSAMHLESNTYIFGLCLSNTIQCTDTDYTQLISHLSHTENFIIKSTPQSGIQVFQLDNDKSEWFYWYYLFALIPLLIIIFQFICVIFKKIPYLIITKCMSIQMPIQDSNQNHNSNSNANGNGNDGICNSNNGSSKPNSNAVLDTVRKSYVYTKHFIEIENAFSLTENSEEIINYKSMTSKINNESGLVYVKGLRGISLILLVVGQVFIILWKSPANIYSIPVFEETIRKFSIGIVFFGIRYSPGILFSCSGFILVFKLMCFLDDKREEINNKDLFKDINNNNNSKLDQDTSIESLQSSSNLNESKDSIAVLIQNTNKKQKKVSIRAMIVFCIYQIHKYFIMILLIFFIKFTLYYFKIMITTITPIWEYLFHFSITSRNSLQLFLDIFLQILCMKNFLFGDEPEFEEEILEIFWVVNNEIVFFLITTIVIFIFYRIRKSINVLVISVSILLIIIRIVLTLTLKHYQSTIYYTSDHYGKFFRNPIYNYPFYLIGVFFGLINYVIQKGMTIKSAKDEHKAYLINVIVNARILLKQSTKVTIISTIVIFILIILFSMSQPLILLLFDKYSDFVTSIPVNLFYLIDTELVVFSLHYVFFILFIKGDNVLSNMISASIWSIPHKMYYSIIAVMSMVIYFFFYQSETRIMLRMSNITFFSLIIWCLIFIIAFILFILFEVPYKRIIRFMTHKDNIGIEIGKDIGMGIGMGIGRDGNGNIDAKEDTLMLNLQYND